MHLENWQTYPKEKPKDNKLETTEIQTKIVEKKINRTHPPLRVNPQRVAIPSPGIPKMNKTKERTPQTPHQLLYKEKEY